MAEPIWLVSVHDVMPETIGVVRELVQQLDDNDIGPLTLLVVPGGSWAASEIDWLRSRQQQGDSLAGHGWVHHAAAPRGIYDRLHRRFFSRGVAEHLPLNTPEISALILRCHNWFDSNNLMPAELYVPPAWAMGDISRDRLRELPFHQYETLAGVYDSRTDRFQRIPLVGFEADTRFRALFLRLSNALNRAAARVSGQLRVAIHPRDLQLNLRADLDKAMTGVPVCSVY
ncbi:MAG: polysaccharide deacetylase family protein [Gammaproteobacteria bacterium]|nr:polysaccharide deacetylase family protein [Gammaproteobacteria bacterium]